MMTFCLSQENWIWPLPSRPCFKSTVIKKRDNIRFGNPFLDLVFQNFQGLFKLIPVLLLNRDCFYLFFMMYSFRFIRSLSFSYPPFFVLVGHFFVYRAISFTRCFENIVLTSTLKRHIGLINVLDVWLCTMPYLRIRTGRYRRQKVDTVFNHPIPTLIYRYSYTLKPSC